MCRFLAPSGALSLLLLITALSVGCDSGTDAPAPAPKPTATPAPPQVLTASAKVAALGDSGVSGTVSFTQGVGPVSVVVEISGLTPGDHGFHVHETGDCSAPDGKSAGGHFNPASIEHGNRGAEPSHAGDLGNIEAMEGGKAVAKFDYAGFSLSAGPNNIIGRAVVVHQKADDLSTQPSGAAGARVACGVIVQGSGEAVKHK